MNKFEKLEKALRRAIYSGNEAEVSRVREQCETLPLEAADELPLLDAYVGNPFLTAADGAALVAVIDGVEEAVIENMQGEKKKDKKRSYKKENKEKEARLLFLTS